MKLGSIASISLILAIAGISHADVNLTFTSPVPGTIPDANGLGTGFTDRLPLTGTIYGNDPNLNLLSNPGQLTITSGVADTLGPQDLNQMETFGVQEANTTDFVVSAQFNDIGVESAQLQLFAGIDGNHFIRAGFHDNNGTDTSVFIYGIVNGVQTPYYVQVPTGVLPGDNATLTLRQTGGQWSISWQSLTHPAAYGTSPLQTVSLPDLSTFPTLYTGIYYNTPPNRSPQTETTGLVSFSVQAVPEPSSLVIAGIAILCGAGALWRRRKMSA